MSNQVKVNSPEDVVLPEDEMEIKKALFYLRRMVVKYKERADKEQAENNYLRNHVRKLNDMIDDLQGKKRPLISQSL